jgi:hypothetical protein
MRLHLFLRPIVLVLILAVSGMAADLPNDSETAVSKRLWIASMMASIAATSFDAATSWGKVEGNTLLASRNGTFGPKGLTVKIGLETALVLPQLWLRKHKELRSAFTLGNFGEAAVFSGAAVHNLRIPASG